MIRIQLIRYCLLGSMLLTAVCDLSADEITARPAFDATVPGKMVQDSLLRQVQDRSDVWERQYEERTEPSEIEAYQSRTRQFFIDQIGGLPERSDLNSQITGRIERDGFTVEKVMFESLPDFHVTGGLFLPDPERFPPPWSAIVVVCGHTAEGKLSDIYQSGTALAAMHGMAAFIIDPIGQGERKQVLDEEGQPAVPSATTEHSLLGTASMLVGWNTARWEIWDAMRAVDYLQSRDDIRGDRIGCMGNSGGGTQTSYLMALDDRIQAAAPSCYITSFERLLETIGPQDSEQNIHAQLGFGMDHADYVMMRAPRPTMIACATDDFFDISGTWDTFRHAKRLYTRMGAGRNVGLVEVDAGHGWHPLIRRASVAFMAQHLDGRLIDVPESDIQVLAADEFQVSPDGQVLRMEGQVSAFDMVRREHERLAKQRDQQRENASPAEFRQHVRTVAGVRPLAELPQPAVTLDEPQRAGELTHQRVILQVDEDVWLPAVLVRGGELGASQSEGELFCVLDSSGKDAAIAPGGVAESHARQGHTVLAIDIRGVGETAPEGSKWYHERFGANGGNAMVAYLLGKSFVGMRTEDILQAARWLAESENGAPVHLIATGELTVPALHAAALEPDLFSAVELEGGLASWAHVVESPLTENQVVNAIHGALRVYDLPVLEEMLGDRLTVRDRRGAAGESLQN